MGVLEGLKELKSKHLTWKRVIKNRLYAFATPMSFRDHKTWWILSLLPQRVYSVSIKLNIRAKRVINVSSTNIFGDTSSLILSRETQLAPSTRNNFPIKKKIKKLGAQRQVSDEQCTTSLDWITSQWSLIDSIIIRYDQMWSWPIAAQESTSRYLTDYWLPIGRAKRCTVQLLGKTCCLGTGCGVIRQSNCYLLMAVLMLLVP